MEGDRRRQRVLFVFEVGVIGGGENTGSLLVSRLDLPKTDKYCLISHMPGVTLPEWFVERLRGSCKHMAVITGPLHMVRYPRNVIALMRYGLRCVGAIRRARPDVVVLQTVCLPLVITTAAKAGCLSGKVVSVVRSEFRKIRLGASRRIVRGVVERMTSKFVAVSESVAVSLERDFLVPRKKIHVIHNGWDLTRFKPGTQRRRGGLPTVISVGRLTDQKDHATLIRAIGLLRAAGHRDVRLRVVGDGPLRGELEALAHDLGLGDCTEFLGQRGDVSALLQEADVFALCSVREGLCGAVAEAMATGLPVVASDIGPMRELIEHGNTGLLVAPGDVQAVAEALRWVLAHRKEAAYIGQRARLKALKFDVAATVLAWERLLAEL